MHMHMAKTCHRGLLTTVSSNMGKNIAETFVQLTQSDRNCEYLH